MGSSRLVLRWRKPPQNHRTFVFPRRKMPVAFDAVLLWLHRNSFVGVWELWSVGDEYACRIDGNTSTVGWDGLMGHYSCLTDLASVPQNSG